MRKLSLMRIVWLAIIPIMLVGCESTQKSAQELHLGTFGAFYTKLNSGEDFEQYTRTGEYADIVVDLGTGNSKLE